MTDDWLTEEELPQAQQTLPADDKIRMLANLADNYAALEEEIAIAEEKLKILQERFRLLREDIIPERMMDFGIKKIVLEDGSTLGFGSFYAGKVLDEKAYAWLEANGYSDAIKQELKLETSRADNIALEFIKAYIENHPKSLAKMSVKEKQAIHHMTLGTIIKDLTRAGKQLPPNLIETYIGNRAFIRKGRTDE